LFARQVVQCVKRIGVPAFGDRNFVDHDNKRFVQVYDYVDNYVLMLARMYERRLKGYAAIGYVVEQETLAPVPPTAARA
jgi:hypothetical protein